MEQEKFVKNEAKVCPVCGGHNLEYLDSDEYINEVHWYWACDDCGAIGIEKYELSFIGHDDVVTKEEMEE